MVDVEERLSSKRAKDAERIEGELSIIKTEIEGVKQNSEHNVLDSIKAYIDSKFDALATALPKSSTHSEILNKTLSSRQLEIISRNNTVKNFSHESAVESKHTLEKCNSVVKNKPADFITIDAEAKNNEVIQFRTNGDYAFLDINIMNDDAKEDMENCLVVTSAIEEEKNYMTIDMNFATITDEVVQTKSRKPSSIEARRKESLKSEVNKIEIEGLPQRITISSETKSTHARLCKVEEQLVVLEELKSQLESIQDSCSTQMAE